jgi:hypothetical protein
MEAAEQHVNSNKFPAQRGNCLQLNHGWAGCNHLERHCKYLYTGRMPLIREPSWYFRFSSLFGWIQPIGLHYRRQLRTDALQKCGFATIDIAHFPITIWTTLKTSNDLGQNTTNIILEASALCHVMTIWWHWRWSCGHTTISVSGGRCTQKCWLKNHSFAIWGLHCLPDSKEMWVFF